MSDITKKRKYTIHKRNEIPIQLLQLVRRRLFLPIVVLFAEVLCTLINITPVYATSTWDNAYTHQTGAFVETSICPEQDVTSQIKAQLASSSGWPSGHWYAPNELRDYFQNIVNGSVPGMIAITQMDYPDYDYRIVGIFPVQLTTTFTLSWESQTDLGNYARIYYPPFYGITGYQGGMYGFELDASCHLQFHNIGNSSIIPITSDDTGTVIHYKSLDLIVNGAGATFDYNYPTGYAGTLIDDGSVDRDDDGLTATQELEQGTSDSKIDSDGDGINDYAESIWNTDRDDEFCDTSTTPYTCAYPSPMTKDLYVEIDWMNDGTNSYKPDEIQLGLVSDMFANKGILFHADTGQYGGGQQLATYTETLANTFTPGDVDFWDYQSGGDGITQSFAGNRAFIWHYMISGYNYTENTGSSGWATALGSNLFISYGLIKNMTGLADENRAIADTIAHELGHNLCLSDTQVYEEQPEECVYAGIDNKDNGSNYYNLEDYESVMNYRYQLTDIDDLEEVNYSDGIRGADDHDDWGAVLLGMGGFSGTHTLLGAQGNALRALNQNESESNFAPDGTVIIEDSSME